MKSEFMLALTQLAAERNLPKEVVLKAVEAALVSAFRKGPLSDTTNITVKIMPQSGEVRVYVQKTVVENPADTYREISLAGAQQIRKEARVGEFVEVESTPKDAGRIAAQTAKQVVLQRLREAGRDVIYGEYADREGKLVSGVVERTDPRHITVNLGRATAVLPVGEQMANEHCRVGQRLKFYLKEVLRTGRGPQLIVSRSHPNLLRCLFELEIPEIANGTVELKAVAREPGYRSKVAIAARQEGVDPIGCCIGLRGTRIQNIIKELNGEKIDVVKWDPSLAAFVANALGPASVTKVEISEETKTATVIVPDRQLSLAIGKDGQNARLAAKLTGWRIDIQSLSMVQAQTGEKPVPVVEELALIEVVSEPAPEAVVAVVPEPVGVVQPVEVVPAAPVEPEAPSPVLPQEPAPMSEEVLSDLDRTVEKIFAEVKLVEKPHLRFAEDIGHRRIELSIDEPGVKPKAVGKKKKGVKKSGGRRFDIEDDLHEVDEVVDAVVDVDEGAHSDE